MKIGIVQYTNVLPIKHFVNKDEENEFVEKLQRCISQKDLAQI